MNKKIITIAEIAFALIFIILMSVIFSNVLGFGSDANANLANIREYAAEADLAPYNSTIVSGDTVVSTINKMKETKDGLKLSYIVDNTSYGYESINSSEGNTAFDSTGKAMGSVKIRAPYTNYKKYNARPGQADFISPVTNYNSEMIFNSNGVFVGVQFTTKP